MDRDHDCFRESERGGMLMRGITGGVSFPDAATTGPAAAGYDSLIPQVAEAIPASGPYPSWVQVLAGGALLVEGCSFTASFDCHASNITFRGCAWNILGPAFYPVNEAGTCSGWSFEWCEMAGTSLDPTQVLVYGVNCAGDNATVIGCNLYAMSEQPLLFKGNNILVQGNYVHDLAATPLAHADPLFLYGQNNIQIIGNTLLGSPIQNTSAAIFGSATANYDGVLISGNLLAGGSFTIYGGYDANTVTNWVTENNWFSTMYYPQCGIYGYQTAFPAIGSGGNVWRDNYWYDGPNAGQLVAAPLCASCR